MALVRLLLHCSVEMGCVSQAVRLGQGIAAGSDAPRQAALAGGLWLPLTPVRQRVVGSAIRTLLSLCWTWCSGLRKLGCIRCFLSSCADAGWRQLGWQPCTGLALLLCQQHHYGAAQHLWAQKCCWKHRSPPL